MTSRTGNQAGSDPRPALALAGVSKSFGGVQAVRAVDLTVRVGERRALIGPNGAGKSTLFNLIAGELAADQGRIAILGADATHKSVQQRARLGMGRTYQISQLFLNLTVEENLFLAGAAKTGIELRLLRPWAADRKRRAQAQEVAEVVGLAGHLEQQVKELSHGLQRQLEVGMAIAMRPKLILLDEPAAGLSPSERATLTSLIRSLPGEITLLLIEHDMEIVLELAERISVMHQGSLIVEGTPPEIRGNQLVQEIYLGSLYA